MIIQSENEKQMILFGTSIGNLLHGGEVIELVGDVGSGKTTLTKGIAIGLGVEENIQSPTFTISRVYQGRDNISLAHYDFYRLNDAGIMSNELSEDIEDSTKVTVIEWSELIKGVLPKDRLSIEINTISDNVRKLSITPGGNNSRKIVNKLSK